MKNINSKYLFDYFIIEYRMYITNSQKVLEHNLSGAFGKTANSSL